MIKFLLCVFLTTAGSLKDHPLHVSVTEINYDEKDRALEIMMRVFADDLETAMRERHNIPDLDISNPRGKSLDDLAREYVSSAVAISLDGKRQTLNYLGNERDGEAFIFYIEVPKVKKWKNVSVTNSILTEIFDDQSNLVHVTSGNTVRSLRLNKVNPSGLLTFAE